MKRALLNKPVKTMRLYISEKCCNNEIRQSARVRVFEKNFGSDESTLLLNNT